MFFKAELIVRIRPAIWGIEGTGVSCPIPARETAL